MNWGAYNYTLLLNDNSVFPHLYKNITLTLLFLGHYRWGKIIFHTQQPNIIT